MENKPLSSRSRQDDRERLELIIKATGVGIWDWQILTGELSFNERWADIIGYSVDELHSVQFETWASNLHPSDLEKAKQLLQQHFNGETDVYEVEVRMLHKLGHYVWVFASGKLIERDASGQPKRMIGLHLDITERKQYEERLIVSSQLLNESQEVAKLGGWELNLVTGLLFWTDETYRIHETSPDKFDPTVDAGVGFFLPESQVIISDALDKAINQGIGYDLELETYTTKGNKIDVRTTCTVEMKDGKAIRLAGIFQDITEQKHVLRKLEKINLDLEDANSALQLSAHYDSLTELPNRNLLTDRMQQAMSRCLRSQRSVAVAFIDLDNFKEINDKYGHSVGDALLKQVAKDIQAEMRSGDTLSRFGGDEFIALIDDLDSPSDSDEIIDRILNAISTTFEVEGKLLSISASIGVTYFPFDNCPPDQLLRHADQAMYIAKQHGKNQRHTFDIEHDVATKQHAEELKRIGLALTQNEFELFYQPQVNLITHRVVGVEALIRWHHPERGLLSPYYFLPVIENDVLEVDLGRWVIQAALRQLHAWSSAGIEIPVSVNISPMHLQHPRFTSELADMLSQYPDFKPNSLHLEILESSALKDITQASKVIESCGTMGVLFSIDDFGAGYSSLTYLKRLPAKYLKIDQSFVIDMLKDMDDRAIIQGIIELAKVFNLRVIAEGVETPDHAEQLLSLGATLAQGYGIAKPMPVSEFSSWLAAWKTAPLLVDRSE